MPTDPIRHALVNSDARSRRVSGALSRGFDVLVALLALTFFAPVLLLIGLAIMQQRCGSMLVRHQRVGRDGVEFKMLEFRTTAAFRAGSAQTSSEPHLLRMSEFLTASGLKRLPQLLNVLIGKMSIVGPRPMVPEDVQAYGPHYTLYCSVRPGITGVSQLSSLTHLSATRRLEMDALYARKKSVLLDLQIMLQAIPDILMRQDLS